MQLQTAGFKFTKLRNGVARHGFGGICLIIGSEAMYCSLFVIGRYLRRHKNETALVFVCGADWEVLDCNQPDCTSRIQEPALIEISVLKQEILDNGCSKLVSSLEMMFIVI
jgi:hypothetical protein